MKNPLIGRWKVLGLLHKMPKQCWALLTADPNGEWEFVEIRRVETPQGMVFFQGRLTERCGQHRVDQTTYTYHPAESRLHIDRISIDRDGFSRGCREDCYRVAAVDENTLKLYPASRF